VANISGFLQLQQLGSVATKTEVDKLGAELSDLAKNFDFSIFALVGQQQ